MNVFVFFLNKIDLKNDSDTKVARIRLGIKDKRMLLDLFSSELDFPEYFGENWDALYDCLADLNWVIEKRIIIVHDDIPLDSIHEQKIYIQMLFDLKIYWDEHKKYHCLDIYFPKEFEKEIEKLMYDIRLES